MEAVILQDRAADRVLEMCRGLRVGPGPDRGFRAADSNSVEEIILAAVAIREWKWEIFPAWAIVAKNLREKKKEFSVTEIRKREILFSLQMARNLERLLRI